MSEPAAEVRIGVSACLLGQKVRFDGGHKRSAFVTDLLGQFVTFVPVCPEVEIGLGTPRETLHLVRLRGEVRMITTKTQVDHTERMAAFAARKVAELKALDLSGYILKKDSPSCGMERVKVYDASGVPWTSGRGLFAEALLRELPLLPVEEEGRLKDPRLRENFIERVFAYQRLRDFFSSPWKADDLIRFHSGEKFLVLAHHPASYERLGRLVTGVKKAKRKELWVQYEEAFMTSLAKIATPRRHANVLQHMAGYFKAILGSTEKQELADSIHDYWRGLLPLIVPITLIRHYTRLHKIAYLEGQSYLEPHPKELMLRNHV